MPVSRKSSSLGFFRAEKMLHDEWLRVLTGQRRYEVVPDGTGDRFAVMSTIKNVEAAQIVISGGDLQHVAGPFKAKAYYSDTAGVLPTVVELKCLACGWTSKQREWRFRRHFLNDALRHRCPD